jgi:hypothetical protein
MKLIFWRRKPKPQKHLWDGNYVCFDCNIYWHSAYPEEHFGDCPGPTEEEDDD